MAILSTKIRYVESVGVINYLVGKLNLQTRAHSITISEWVIK